MSLDGLRVDLTTVTHAFIEEQRRPGASLIMHSDQSKLPFSIPVALCLWLCIACNHLG